MKLAVWPADPARRLAAALRASGVVTDTAEVAPFEAKAVLAGGRADLALVPTLDVLRAPEAFLLVPGVALAGEQDPLLRLVVRSPLNAIGAVAFDPRHGQAALLAQIVLKEHYGVAAMFAPVPDPPAVQGDYDAAFIPAEAAPSDAVVLDLGREWTDLTLRPMVWGLLAARSDVLNPASTQVLRDAARAAEAVDDGVFQLTLDGYAHDGLDEFVKHLYYHGTLTDMPELPFLALPEEDEAEA